MVIHLKNMNMWNIGKEEDAQSVDVNNEKKFGVTDCNYLSPIIVTQ